MRSIKYYKLVLEKEQIESSIVRLEKRLELNRNMLVFPENEISEIELSMLIENLEKRLKGERERLIDVLQKMDEESKLPEIKRPNVNVFKKWADLSKEAKSILEWTEHVWSGVRQVLVIERGTVYRQFGLNINVTDQIFDEIISYLSSSSNIAYDIQGEDTVELVEIK